MSGTWNADPAAVTDALLALQAAEFDAMVAGDVTALDTLLAPTFTLTHMTGYEQTRADWLTDIGADQMVYHRIDPVHSALNFEGPHPVLTVRTRTDATIWGAHGTWRLQLRSTFAVRAEGWIFARTVASTW
jgi:hypothetical protein